jgi:hypothetical protein
MIKAIEPRWEKRAFCCDGAGISTETRRFEVYADAAAALKRCYRRVYKRGGAAFIGYTAPILAHAPAEFSLAGEWFVELFLIQSIAFGQLLSFVEHIGFGMGGIGNDVPREVVEARRKNAKGILLRMNEQVPTAIMEISRGSLGTQFLEATDESLFDCFFNEVIAFNRDFFSVEVSEVSLRRLFRKANGFSLGYC